MPSASPEPKVSEPETAPRVILTAKGLRSGSEALLFNAGRSEVETALTSVLGKPNDRSNNDECGAGRMEFTDFDGGLTVNFQEGRLVGWNWRSAQDGDAPAKAEISTDTAAQLGNPRASVEVASGFDVFEESTLGDEFSIGDLYGFFEEGKVSMLYAGSQCFFR